MTHESPEKSASWLSRLLFVWVRRLVHNGNQKPVEFSDLFSMMNSEKPEPQARAFERAYAQSSGKRYRLFRTLLKMHRSAFFRVNAFAVVMFVCLNGNPFLLRKVIAFIEHPGPLSVGLLLASSLFVSTLVGNFAAHHLFFQALKISMRVKGALICAIYAKALRLSPMAQSGSSTGEVVNLMATDTSNMDDTPTYVHLFWTVPLQIVVAVSALFYMLGISALAGVAILVVLGPIIAKVSQKRAQIRRHISSIYDERVTLMNEILRGIRIIKFYAWERSFRKEVGDIREREISQLMRLSSLGAVSGLIFLSAPILVGIATFGVHVLLGKGLSAPDVFASLVFFGHLRMALGNLSHILNNSVDARVSARRLEQFFELEEIKERSASTLPPGTVNLSNASFAWQKGEDALRRIELLVQPGDFVVVVGDVGAGKSSLLSALLGEMEKTAGECDVSGRIVYVSQQAWILNRSLRENILFGDDFDSERYERALSATALAKDLALLPDGDNTEIGERGVNLSGGQKQRVSLARALYARGDVYLFDDPLSAVDALVGRHIFKDCFLRELRKKTRVLITHRLEYLSHADKIVIMEDGRVAESGSFNELSRNSERLKRMLSEYHRASSQLARQSEDVSVSETAPSADLPLQNEPNGKLVLDEERRIGAIGRDVYVRYVRAFAAAKWIVFLGVVFVLREVFQTGSDFWLAHWSGSGSNRLVYFWLVFSLLGVLAALATFARELVGWRCGVHAAARFHETLLDGVLRAPMSFFERTPVGRVLNRFGADTETIDRRIPGTLLETLGCLAWLLSSLVTIIIVTPLTAFVFVPLAFFYYRFQKLYRAVSREVRRLQSIARSPIYAHFSETLGGLGVLRAYKREASFYEQNVAKLDVFLRTFYTQVAVNRWLGIRLELLGASIVAAASFFAVLGADHVGSVLGAGLAGMSVTYALSITGFLNWTVRIYSELEINMNAVERVGHYSGLTAEKWSGETLTNWPTCGRIEFQNLEMRYRPELEPALHSLSVTIEAGQRVGIVGRTGAGKSSLLLALFRMVEPSGGRILIDGVDTQNIALETLRSRIAIIPQDPVLFAGTVRRNLDPFSEFSEVELWNALKRAHLFSALNALPEKLESKVNEGGSNFSVGQRQLLCLARALLRRAKILLLDEATASVDYGTDALIQQTLREEFAGCTVLTIAHRLNTVLDSDRILVLAEGMLVEFGSPADLAASQGGYFREALEQGT